MLLFSFFLVSGDLGFRVQHDLQVFPYSHVSLSMWGRWCKLVTREVLPERPPRRTTCCAGSCGGAVLEMAAVVSRDVNPKP